MPVFPPRSGSDTDWRWISAGSLHSMAIKADGSLWATGANFYGELGNGSTTSENEFVRIGSDNDWVGVSASHMSSYAIKSDGTIWAWGDNGDSRLGDGT